MSQFIRIFSENPNQREIDKVVKVLRKGGIIIYPTDTVYGIGCDISNAKAMEKIAKLKGLKLHKAKFSIICYDLSNLSDYIKQIDTATFKILKRALPGPFTFILPINNRLPKTFKTKKTVGIRIPDNTIIRELVHQLGNPIVSSSIRDEDDLIEYTTDPELIFEKWKNNVDVVIDGGYGGNIPSTVIDLSEGDITVLRVGKGNVDDLE